MAALPCEDGAGSLNNPNASSTQIGTNNPALKPYVAPDLQIGEWEISKLNQDDCANNDQLRQETYVAETLNISGAPVNIFKLLGVHEQGNGSLIDSGAIIATTPSPGYPISNINSEIGSWKSLQTGSETAQSYVGVDFGYKVLSNGRTEYEPKKVNFTVIGSIAITQASTPNEFAKQVKVEITDGSTTFNSPSFFGVGNGVLNTAGISLGSNASQGFVLLIATSISAFDVFHVLQNGSTVPVGVLEVGKPFNSTIINVKINSGSIDFQVGDTFSIPINYVWKRVGLFNLTQSPLAQTLNFTSHLYCKALKITPTLFTGSGGWEVISIDVFSSMQTNINNIQDLFFGENRDRDYAKEPLLIKVQYTPSDSITDLSKFGLSILDQYSFTASFSAIVKALGRPIVVGDIIEVIPELQYDQNLKPIRKFLEVTDTSWAAEGFSTFWKPTLIRFVGEQALPSQETRDIFGTIDTQKYLVADSILMDAIGEQIDITPLTQLEELIKETENLVPEIGSNDAIATDGSPIPQPQPPRNPKGQPDSTLPVSRIGVYIEDGLPPNNEEYGEGFKLPDATTVSDGDYFRLYYPPESKIPPRLYRYSSIKNRWIYQETDRRGDYSSHKPTVRSILKSDTKQPLKNK